MAMTMRRHPDLVVAMRMSSRGFSHPPRGVDRLGRKHGLDVYHIASARRLARASLSLNTVTDRWSFGLWIIPRVWCFVF